MTASRNLDPTTRLEATANFLAPTFILLTPFVTYLRYHGYDLLSTEALICLAGFAVLGLLISALIGIRPETLRPMVLLALTLPWTLALARSSAYLALDWVGQWGGIGAEHYRIAGRVAFGAIGLLAVVFWLMRRHIGLIVATVFGVMLAVAAAGSSGTEPQVVRAAAPPPLRADLPPVVHLVLDEHIGVAGIPEDIPGGRELKRDIVAFYERHGFRLYPNAFSHYWNTEDSLANLLNGTLSPMMHADVAVDRTFRMLRNHWFDKLSGRGYRIDVVQSSYLSFCATHDVDRCMTYAVNSVGALRREPGVKRSNSVASILQSYLERRAMFHFFSPLYEDKIRPAAASAAGLELPGWNWDHLVFGPVTSRQLLADIAETIGERPGGTALFAHLILPHNTYLYDARCETNPDFLKWVDRNRTVFWPFISNTPEDRAQRYVRYFDQLRCTYRMLDALFDAMRASGKFDRAMIFVHGDHGSRIALTDPLPQLADRLTSQDVIDSYSTLYAVRIPGAGASLSTETRSIQDLFAEHALGEPRRTAFRRVFLVSLPKWRLQPLDIYANEFDLEREQGGQHASQR